MTLPSGSSAAKLGAWEGGGSTLPHFTSAAYHYHLSPFLTPTFLFLKTVKSFLVYYFFSQHFLKYSVPQKDSRELLKCSYQKVHICHMYFFPLQVGTSPGSLCEVYEPVNPATCMCSRYTGEHLTTVASL